MTAEPLAGLILAGFTGTAADADDAVALADLGVGGFIVFGRNVVDPEQVALLLSDLRARCGDRPLLLAVDQEGGRVARLRAPLTVWPPMGALGERSDPELARATGRALADEIGAVGFNLDFAPCLDVNSNPDNPVIGDRSLGATTDLVSRLGVPLLQGIQAAGVAACAKHFPGHGHVDVDSHYDLPVCPLDADALFAQHVAPFEAAIAAGVAAVMTAHVIYPAIDPDNPATLSPTWIDGVLRGRLGWQGPVLTDDLEMGAIVDHGGIGDAVVRAVRAGVDGLLICARRDRIEDAAGALRAEADRDHAFAARCQQSLERLQDLAGRWPSRPVSPLGDAIGINEAVANQVRGLGAVAHSGPDPTEASATPG